MSAASIFLGKLFGDFLDAGNISVFTLPSRTVKFCADVEQAVAQAEKLKGTEDVYFGVGLYKSVEGSGRGKVSDVAGITSFWADIDYGPNHAKAKMPPVIESAERILTCINAPPSIVVHSGHGLHAYWRLKEFLPVEDDAETLARRWGATVLCAAEYAGYVVDPVSDLARVMRIPGTNNHKEPVHVKMVETRLDDGPIYDLVDLVDLMVPDPAHVSITGTVVGSLVIDPAASPSIDAIEALTISDQRFAKTWEQKRTDLKDSSPSGYEMSLANFGYLAGWTDQQVCDLVIAWARKHNINRAHKHNRPGYMAQLLAKAKANQQHIDALDELSVSQPTKDTKLAPSERQRTLDTLTQALGVPIKEWIQHGTEQATYTLILTDGQNVEIGGVASYTNQKTFRDRILEATTILPRKLKGNLWEAIVSNLGRIVEVIESEELTRTGRLAEWVESYTASQLRVNFDPADLGAIVMKLRPFQKGGAIHIHAQGLVKYIKIAIGENVEKKEVVNMFHVSGWTRVAITFRVDGVNKCKSYWRDRPPADETGAEESPEAYEVKAEQADIADTVEAAEAADVADVEKSL